MKIKIPYLRYSIDWTTNEINEIETDDYSYFRIENRGSSHADWWILGYNNKYKLEDNLTGHGCCLKDVVEFYHNNKDKVKQINVLHFYEGNNALDIFYKRYAEYLKKVIVTNE